MQLLTREGLLRNRDVWACLGVTNIYWLPALSKGAGQRFIHPLNKYLLSTYWVQGSVLGSGDLSANKIAKCLPF